VKISNLLHNVLSWPPGVKRPLVRVDPDLYADIHEIKFHSNISRDPVPMPNLGASLMGLHVFEPMPLSIIRGENGKLPYPIDAVVVQPVR
jgi:hypothetical protein